MVTAITTSPHEHVIVKLSPERFQNLLEFLGNIAHYIVAIVYTEGGVTLIIQLGGWRRIEFDFDEGYSRTGYRLITIPTDSSSWPEITRKLFDSDIQAELLASYDSYLVLVSQKDLDKAVESLKN